jgi:hypothetical protein
MDEALGRELDLSRVKQCFGCHNTAAVTDGKLNLAEMIPGVTCESCHGPGARHIESVKAGTATTPEIVNPAQMEPDAMNDFCGCCHRTSFQVEKSLGRWGCRVYGFNLIVSPGADAGAHETRAFNAQPVTIRTNLW